MEGIEHKMVKANGLNIHIAEMGQGPLVLLLHGFPELWYSWRHQILYLAARGYRAVSPDLRGYGDTTGAPANDISKFTTHHIAGDIVALIDAIAGEGEDKVFLVGHDFGAYMAWHLSMYRPDKVKALVNLSVHFSPRNPEMKIVASMRALYGDDHYICRFQEPGKIEAEFASVGTKTALKKFFMFRDPAPFYFPNWKFTGSPDAPVVLPSWLSEEDIDYFASKFEKSGFSGPVNYYRAFDLDWELNAPWTGAQVTVPAKFIVGDLDLVYNIPVFKEYIHNGGFKKDVPLLEDVVVMEGVAHFINQEKPDEISKYIYDFIQKF